MVLLYLILLLEIFVCSRLICGFQLIFLFIITLKNVILFDGNIFKWFHSVSPRSSSDCAFLFLWFLHLFCLKYININYFYVPKSPTWRKLSEREGSCGKGDGLLWRPLWAVQMGLFQPIMTCDDNKSSKQSVINGAG